MVDVAKGGSNGNENSHLSLYPGAKLTLSGAIAYMSQQGEPSGIAKAFASITASIQFKV